MDAERIDVSGRMIFFLYAPEWVKDELIGALVRLEYKACYLDDHGSLLKLITLYPGAIVFVNIDRGPKEDEWYRMLTEMKDQIRATDVRLGVFSEENRKSVIEKWLRGVDPAAGFISMHTRRDEIRKRVLQTAASAKAIGRRKYVRAKPEGTGNATVNIKYPGGQYSGTILDISSAGMACKIPEAESFFSMNDHIDDIQIRLNARLTTVSGHIAGVRQESDSVFVILFDQSNSTSVEERIHEYVRETLQRDFEKRMRNP